MIYVVHGDDYTKSRKLVVNQQNKLSVESKTELDIDEITSQKLQEAVSSFDLFGNPPFVVLNVSKAKSNKSDSLMLEKFIEVLIRAPKQAVIIILADKTLGKTNIFIKKAQELKAKVITNKKAPVSNVFNFVDALFSKNPAITYKQLRLLEIDNTDPFYIFSMILYGLRNIAHAKFSTSEFTTKSPYIQSKTNTQALNFSQNSIYKLFEKLYQTDKKLKTGQTSPEIALLYTIESILNA